MSINTSATLPRARLRVTQTRVIKSEWIKLRSLRSTLYTLLVAGIFMIGIGALVSYGTESHFAQMDPHERANFDPALSSLRGVFLAQLAIGVLGVLIVTGEYATGMIRASLGAVPKRLPVLWAKLLVFGVVALVLMTISSFIAFGIGQSILATQHIGTSLGNGAGLRQVFGAGLYLGLVGLLAVALGTILRSTAGAIATLFGLLLVLPILGEVLPSSWHKYVVPYLPSNAGQDIMGIHNDPGSLSAWAGTGLFAAYVVLAVAIAAVMLRRRDA